jgi:hypothetical protein
MDADARERERNHRRKGGNLGRHRAALVSADTADSSLRREVLKRDPRILDASTILFASSWLPRNLVYAKGATSGGMEGDFAGMRRNLHRFPSDPSHTSRADLFAGSIHCHCSVPVSSHGEILLAPAKAS